MPTIITRGATSALAYGWSRLSGAVADAYFKYVTMLLPGNGTNGAQNNTFLDGSSNAFSITRNGNATQGTFSPYGSNWSNYFTSSSGYIRVPASANLASNANSFTLEFWYNSNNSASGRPCGNGNNDTWAANKWVFANQATGKLEFFVYNYSSSIAMLSSTSSTVAYDGQWHHIAIVRSSNTWAMFIDGTRQGTSVTSTVSLNGTSSTINVGWSYLTSDASAAFSGYISNFRFVNGTAVYDPTQSTISVPTGPLTAITNTAFLTCQSNRFVDNSTNAFAITISGTPSVQRFSPFSPSAAYSTTTTGGSGYFDGAGDSLTSTLTGSALGSGAFTFECWAYMVSPTSDAGVMQIASSTSPSNAGIGIIRQGAGLWGLVANGTFTAGTISAPLNSWAHLAVTRSGSTVTLWVNGASSISITDTTNYTGTTLLVGYYYSTSYYMQGYISDVRSVTGTAVYTAAFTPPTAPLTAITNTKLLLNMTNAGIIDNAMMGDGETVGSAQISTTQNKFGGSSISFNGTNSYLNFPASVNWVMKRDFTVECWFYVNTIQASMLFDQYTGAGAGNGDWQLYITAAGNVVWYYDNTTSINTSFTVSTGQWYHIACTRSGSSMKVFINGTQYGPTATYSGQFGQNNTMWFGAQHPAGAGYFFAGYADDIRITNGYARYTANFTPPTAAFPTYGS